MASFALRPRPVSGPFSGEATIPAERIDEALDALRTDMEHEIPNVLLTLERMSKLGL